MLVCSKLTKEEKCYCGELYVKYRRFMYSVAMQYASYEMPAEDIVQNASYVMAKYSYRFRDMAEFPFICLNWLSAQLPSSLIRSLRFITNAAVPSEGNGLSLIFCSHDGDQNILRTTNAGGELADVCVCSMAGASSTSAMKKELADAESIVALSDANRKRARLLMSESAGLEEYLRLIRIPFDDPRTGLKVIFDEYGQETAEKFIRDGAYTAGELLKLRNSPPAWLHSKKAIVLAIRHICAEAEPFPIRNRGGGFRGDECLSSPAGASRVGNVRKEPQGETTLHHSPHEEAVECETPEKNASTALNTILLVLVIAGLALVLIAFCVYIFMGLESTTNRLFILISADAVNYIRSAMVSAVCGLAFGVLLVLAIQTAVKNRRN